MAFDDPASDEFDRALARGKISFRHRDETVAYVIPRRPAGSENFSLQFAAPAFAPGKHVTVFVDGERLVILAADEAGAEHTDARHVWKARIPLVRLEEELEAMVPLLRTLETRMVEMLRSKVRFVSASALRTEGVLVGLPELGYARLDHATYSKSKGTRIDERTLFAGARVVRGDRFLDENLGRGLLLRIRQNDRVVAPWMLFRRPAADGALAIHVTTFADFVRAIASVTDEIIERVRACVPDLNIDLRGERDVEEVARGMARHFYSYPERLLRAGVPLLRHAPLTA